MTESSNYRSIDVWDYDFQNDSLFFHSSGIKYKSSIDLGDIILDLGEDCTPIGAEILDASEVLGVPKASLKEPIKFSAVIKISEETIEIIVSIVVISRNRNVEKIAASQGVNDINLPVGQVVMEV
ncbi:MAG: DUF2283 domain-containing protein [Methanosarcina sp.]